MLDVNFPLFTCLPAPLNKMEQQGNASMTLKIKLKLLLLSS